MAEPIKKTQKRGLGRGFDSLLPQSFDKSLLTASDEERIQKLALGDVIADPAQPRRHFDTSSLEELAESIRHHGILLPLVVRPLRDGPDNQYQIVAGERRWRAAKIAGLKTVPVIIRTLKELEQLEISLVENVQRVDLSPLEQAVSLQRLHDQFSVSYESIGKRLGKAPSTIHNMVRLLNLPPAAALALAERKIGEGHARAILALKGQDDKQAYLLNALLEHGWSVRQAERYVTSLKDGVKDEQTVRERVATETPATQALGTRIGTSVSIRRTAKGGKLEIGFKTDAELQRIIDLLS